MARQTISLPDALAERLDRLKDRLNLSKVCAAALERECNMLEGMGRAAADPMVAQAIERLQTDADRWYRRGYEDGRKWAGELATRDALVLVSTPKAQRTPEQDRELAIFVDSAARVRPWLEADADGPRVHREIHAVSQEDIRHGLSVDKGAYETGWTDGAREVAKVVLAALKVGPVETPPPELRSPRPLSPTERMAQHFVAPSMDEPTLPRSMPPPPGRSASPSFVPPQTSDPQAPGYVAPEAKDGDTEIKLEGEF
jgi:hypothetical protein